VSSTTRYALYPSDRLGSIGKYYPYGQERPSATTNDTEKFTGYFRDSATGLDYADQRYHQPGMGRFMTADPAASSAQGNDPGSHNRYAYTGGDPVNRVDRTGRDACDANALVALECDESDDSGFSYYGDGCAWSAYLCPGYAAGIVSSYCSSVGLAFDSSTYSCTPAQPTGPFIPVANVPCGQSLGGILPTSADGTALVSMLLGENSWGLIGTQQYQAGDTLHHPTSSTITTATVGQEDSLMLDVTANLANAHGLSLAAQASNTAAFRGYTQGAARFASYQSSAVGSTECNDLTQASLAYDAFAAGGSVAQTGYNQFRSVVQPNKAGSPFLAKQPPGSLVVGGTFFFTVQYP